MQYYRDLVDELLKYNITPMATLYHWDLPQPLQDQGGWLNKTIVPHFNDYATKCYQELGDKVKHPHINTILSWGLKRKFL